MCTGPVDQKAPSVGWPGLSLLVEGTAHVRSQGRMSLGTAGSEEGAAGEEGTTK